MFDRYVFGVQSYLLTFGAWKPREWEVKVNKNEVDERYERFT